MTRRLLYLTICLLFMVVSVATHAGREDSEEHSSSKSSIASTTTTTRPQHSPKTAATTRITPRPPPPPPLPTPAATTRITPRPPPPLPPPAATKTPPATVATGVVTKTWPRKGSSGRSTRYLFASFKANSQTSSAISHRSTSLPQVTKVITVLVNATASPVKQNNPSANERESLGGSSAEQAVGAISPEESLGGSTAEQAVGAISPEVMYVIIGSVSSIVVVLILGITVCVICSRKKQQAALPVTPRPGGAPFHSQKDVAFPGHSVMKPRRDYTKEPRARIQNAENDILDLRQVCSKEVYEEIPDNKLEDWKGIERRSPYPERGSRPVSEAGTRPLNLSDTKDEPTYLSLVG